MATTIDFNTLLMYILRYEVLSGSIISSIIPKDLSTYNGKFIDIEARLALLNGLSGEIDAKISELKSEISQYVDLSNYATIEDVNQKISEAIISGVPSLTGYATNESVSSTISTILTDNINLDNWRLISENVLNYGAGINLPIDNEIPSISNSTSLTSHVFTNEYRIKILLDMISNVYEYPKYSELTSWCSNNFALKSEIDNLSSEYALKIEITDLQNEINDLKDIINELSGKISSDTQPPDEENEVTYMTNSGSGSFTTESGTTLAWDLADGPHEINL